MGSIQWCWGDGSTGKLPCKHQALHLMSRTNIKALGTVAPTWNPSAGEEADEIHGSLASLIREFPGQEKEPASNQTNKVDVV